MQAKHQNNSKFWLQKDPKQHSKYMYVENVLIAPVFINLI